MKTYEFEKASFTSVLSEPKVLRLITELLSGFDSTPIRIDHSSLHATDSIYKLRNESDILSVEFSDSNHVPFIVSCIANSLKQTNAFSTTGIGKEPGSKSDVDEFGALFVHHQGSFPLLPPLQLSFTLPPLRLFSSFPLLSFLLFPYFLDFPSFLPPPLSLSLL